MKRSLSALRCAQILGRHPNPATATTRLCEDRFGCEDTALDFCAGRYAKHCNNGSDCTDAAVVDVGNTVCG